MSGFRNELSKVADLDNRLRNDAEVTIDKWINTLLDKITDTTYTRIKEELLQKSRKGEYQVVGRSRMICGYANVVDVTLRDKLPQHRTLLQTMGIDVINSLYLKGFPDVHMGYDRDYESFDLECTLIKSIRHDPFFGKCYYSYSLTDIAKYILKRIQAKAAIDGIEVSFSHIFLHDNGFTLEIPDGGDDRNFRGRHGCTGCIMIKYTTTF